MKRGPHPRKGLSRRRYPEGLDSHTRLYKIWVTILQRCHKETYVGYANYGGRGIKVCGAWIDGFEDFASWALAHGYNDTLEIDRRDNNGNYEPENCRWVTRLINSRNKSTNKLLTAFGETKTLQEWSEDSRCNVKYDALRWRYKQGWEPERMLQDGSHWFLPIAKRFKRKLLTGEIR